MCNADVDEVNFYKRRRPIFFANEEILNHQGNKEIKQNEVELKSKQESRDQENYGIEANGGEYKFDDAQSQEQGESTHKFENAAVRIVQSLQTSQIVEEEKDNLFFSSQDKEIQCYAPEDDKMGGLLMNNLNHSMRKLRLEEGQEGEIKEEHYISCKNSLKNLTNEINKSIKFGQLTEDKLLKFRNIYDHIRCDKNRLSPSYQKKLGERLDKFDLSYKTLLDIGIEMQTPTSFSSRVSLVNDNLRKSREESKNLREIRSVSCQSSPRENTNERNLSNRLHKLNTKSEFHETGAENVDVEHGRTPWSTISYENEVKDKSTPNKGKNIPGVHLYGSQQNNLITEQELRPSDGKQFRNQVDNRSQKKSSQESFNRSLHQSENTKNIETQIVRQLARKYEVKGENRSIPEVEHQRTITRSQAKENKDTIEENDYSPSKKSVVEQQGVEQNKYDFRLDKGTSPEDGKLYREGKNYAYGRQSRKEKPDCMEGDRKVRQLQSSREQVEEHEKNSGHNQQNHNERRNSDSSNYQKTYQQDNHQHKSSLENIHEQFPEKNNQIQERESQRKNIEAVAQPRVFNRRSSKEEEDMMDMDRKLKELKFCLDQAEKHGKTRCNYQQEPHNERRYRDNYNYKNTYLQDNHHHRASPEFQHISKNIQEPYFEEKQVYDRRSQIKHIEVSDEPRGFNRRKSREDDYFMVLDRKLNEQVKEHNERRHLDDNYNYNEKIYLQDNHQHRASPEPQLICEQYFKKSHQIQEREPQRVIVEAAEVVVADEPIEILDIHQYFADFDLTTLNDSVDPLTQVKTVEEWAKTFEDKVKTFCEEKYSLEYFVIDEKLMRLIEHLDKLKCQKDEEASTKRIAVIQYINRLHNILDTNAKDD